MIMDEPICSIRHPITVFNDRLDAQASINIIPLYHGNLYITLQNQETREPSQLSQETFRVNQKPTLELNPMFVELSSDSEDSTISPASPCPIVEVAYIPAPTHPTKKMKKTHTKPKAPQRPPHPPLAGV